MKFLNTLLILGLCLGASGCGPSNGTASTEQTSPPLYIDTKLDDFSRVLIAEIAATRDKYVPAANEYLLLAKNHHDPRLAHRAMQLAVDGNDYDKALESAQLWVSYAPTDPAAYFSLGALALEAKNISLSMEAADKALTLHPHWVDGIVLKAQILMSSNKNKEAVAYLSNEVQKQPSNYPLRTAYADILMHMNSYNSAEQQFAILQRSPQFNGYANLNLGKIAMLKNQLPKAVNYLELALNDPSQENFARYLLAAIAEDQHDFDAAIGWYSDIKEGPLFITSQIRVAALMASQNKVADAIYYLNGIPTFNAEEYRQINLAKSSILVLSDKYQEAFTVLSDALKTLPSDNELLIAHSTLAIQLNRFNDSQKDLRQLLKNDPDNVDALTALGDSLIEHTQNYSEADKYLTHGLALAPNNTALLSNMGWLQYRLRNYSSAIDYLQRAWIIGSQVKTAIRLGTVLWQSGDHQAAEALWQEALKKYPNNEALLSTIKTLKP